MYRDRWKRLRQEIGTEAPVVIAGNFSMQRRADSAFRFSQNAPFLWLTGINEPDWRVVYCNGVVSLIAPEQSDVRDLFDGGQDYESILNSSGADSIIEHADAGGFFDELAAEYDTVYTLSADPYEEGELFIANPATARLEGHLRGLFSSVNDCRMSISRLRAIKTSEEVEAIRRAIGASVEGFKQVKARLGNAEYEYQLEATLNAAFRETGAGGHAYDPIVASGANACTLHYSQNSSPLPTNGLVLIDAGAIMNEYAADITRTYSIGKPTDRQVEVHTAVRLAHEKIIDLIKPGVSLKSYSESVDEVMKDALEAVGLLNDRADNKTYRKYFPHAISHGLGIDVHEPLGGYDVFMPGMVLTVEPGIYIPEEGIGVRIEDDILVTDSGNENLSAALDTSL